MFAITLAHLTAKGLQQLDLPGPHISLQGQASPAHLPAVPQHAAQGRGKAPTGPLFLRAKFASHSKSSYGPTTVEMARNSALTKADASIAKARAQVLARGGSIEVFQEPVVEETTQVLSRKRKSATAQGAIASSPEYREDLRRTREANEAEVAEKKAEREERTRTFSFKWAPLVEKAEGLVLKHAPTSAAELGTLLKVGELEAFIVSRTGRTGAAKNNKTGASTITTEA